MPVRPMTAPQPISQMARRRNAEWEHEAQQLSVARGEQLKPTDEYDRQAAEQTFLMEKASQATLAAPSSPSAAPPALHHG